MIKEPLSYHLSPIMYFQVLNFTNFGMKNVDLGKVVIQKWDHLDIKTISAGPTGGLNCEVPLYIKYSYLCMINAEILTRGRRELNPMIARAYFGKGSENDLKKNSWKSHHQEWTNLLTRWCYIYTVVQENLVYSKSIIDRDGSSGEGGGGGLWLGFREKWHFCLLSFSKKV